MDKPSSQILTVKEFATKHRVCPKTVRRWIHKGRIKAFQFGGPGGKLVMQDNGTMSNIELENSN